jgi:hypothetical protein
MKGLSVIFTISLFLLAGELARHLNQTGILPAQNQPRERGSVSNSPAFAPATFARPGTGAEQNRSL